MPVPDSMKVNELDERSLIARISKVFRRPGKSVVVGAGEDDCAVLDIGGDDYLLVTTDMLHRKTDFPPEMSAWQIGWMSVAVNLSDLASKGGRPLGVVMAMGFPPDLDLEMADEIVRGMDECCRRYGTQIIGGDTDSHEELTMTGTALGLVRKEILTRRSGAKPGDFVCVTGHLGTAGAALLALKKKIPVSQEILKGLFEPTPRIDEGMALAGWVTSMMDISDGISLSLHEMSHNAITGPTVLRLKNEPKNHVGSADSVGFRIFPERLPVLPVVRELLSGEELREALLFTGGDFELLFTVSPEKIEKVKRSVQLTVIGEVIKEGIFIESGGKMEELKKRGYEHFGKK